MRDVVRVTARQDVRPVNACSSALYTRSGRLGGKAEAKGIATLNSRNAAEPPATRKFLHKSIRRAERWDLVNYVKLLRVRHIKNRRAPLVVDIERIDSIGRLACGVLRKRCAGLFINGFRPSKGILELQTMTQTLHEANLQGVVPGMRAVGEQIHGSKIEVCSWVAAQPTGRCRGPINHRRRVN